MFKLLISIPLRICSNICKIPCNTIRFQYLQKLSFCSLNTCHWHCHYLIISTIWKISISMVSLKKFSIPVLFSIFCAIHSRIGSPLICFMLSASLLTHHTTMSRVHGQVIQATGWHKENDLIYGQKQYSIGSKNKNCCFCCEHACT